MESNHPHPYPHHHPPYPSSAAAAATATVLLSPPQNSGFLPILPQPPFGMISSINPQTYYYSNQRRVPTPPPPSSHFTVPSFFSHGFAPGGNNNNNNSNEVTDGGVVLGKDHQERRVLDPWSTKVARSKRRLARQRSLTLPRTSSSPTSGNGFDEYSSTTKGQTTTYYPNVDPQAINKTQNLFTFFTPEKKVLKLLLKKELKNSDVGSLGRIVLPKRESEDNLPLLTDKEGMKVVIRDVNSIKKWAMKYKYWANNRSRMYVLENTGDFVKQNGLFMGDTISLYEDDCKKMYVSIERGENYRIAMEKKYEEEQQSAATTAAESNNCYTANNNIIDNEEEEASLALLIEELKHKTTEDHLIQHHQHSNNNNFILFSQNSDLYLERGSSYNNYYNVNNYYNGNKKNESGSGTGTGGEELQFLNHNNGFDQDCFGGLDTLPEVSGFKFPLFDYLNNDRTT